MWWSWRKGLQEITILVDEDWPIVSGQQQFMVLTSVLDVGMFSFVLWQFVAGDDWCSKLFEATKHKLMLDMDVNVEKLLSKCEKWVWKKCLLWSVKVCDCINWNENCYIVLFLWFEKVCCFVNITDCMKSGEYKILTGCFAIVLESYYNLPSNCDKLNKSLSLFFCFWNKWILRTTSCKCPFKAI